MVLVATTPVLLTKLVIDVLLPVVPYPNIAFCMPDTTAAATNPNKICEIAPMLSYLVIGNSGNGTKDLVASSQSLGSPSVGHGMGGTKLTAVSSHTHDAGWLAANALARASAICSGVGGVSVSGIGVFVIVYYVSPVPEMIH